MYEHRAQLRFSATAAMGHINHARFATIFEDARIGLLRHIAGGDDDLAARGIILARLAIDYLRPLMLDDDLAARGIILARLEIDYLRPLMLDDDPVLVRARVVRIGTRSFSIDYELEQRGEVCARGVSVL